LTRDNKKEKSSAPTDNQIYGLPANQFYPSADTTLVEKNENKLEIEHEWWRDAPPPPKRTLVWVHPIAIQISHD